MLEQECFFNPQKYEITKNIYFNTSYTTNVEEWISFLTCQDFLYINFYKQFAETLIFSVYV